MNNTRNRSLAAIMFTDVVGFSAIMHKDESAALELLDNHNKIVQPIVIKYNGTILKPQADGYLMKFSSAVDAVRCGKDIQKEISIYNKEINENENILLRIGIHLGDVVLTENDIFGDGVNIASRLEPLADPGGICISQTVYDQIKNKVEIQTLDLGPADLKNIDSKINIYKVLLEAQKKVEDDNEEGAQKEDTEEPKVSESVDESKLKEAIKEKIKKSIKDSLGSEIPTINIKEKDEEVTIGPGGIKVKEKNGADVTIDLRMSANLITRIVRSFTLPYPCAILIYKNYKIKIKKAKIGQIIVDRNGYKYHGRVKALTEAIRSADITI